MIRDEEYNERIDMMLKFLQHETDVDIEKTPLYDREIYNSISVNNSNLKPYLTDRVFRFANRINCFYDLCRVLGVTEYACEAISIRDPSNQRGLFPLFAERLFKELKSPQADWRMILFRKKLLIIRLLHRIGDLTTVRFSCPISTARRIWWKISCL